MSRFTIDTTPLAGLMLVQRQRLEDERGFLSRLFCADELRAAGWAGPVAQLNHTHTRRRGCIRGLHFQHAPFAEAKLVSCLRGEVWDVAVDLRPGSPTYLLWHGVHLSAHNGRALLLPEGYAHGFQALSDDVEMLYAHSAPHAAQAEGGLHPLDEALAIAWPLPASEMSPRDRAHPRLATTPDGVLA
jgi:dTDP-4-dehydrorhamnose 3,5-epimerase